MDSQERLEQLRKKANALPLLPGVYIMLDEKNQVIYVGKAKALKNRVTSYFRGEHLPKVAAMVEKVRDFQVIVAASEFEALVLENSLIKRHQPRYNILLRDDKGYPFIRVDLAQAYPKMEIAGKKREDGAKYYGPFGGRGLTADIIDTIQKALRLPSCSRQFPRDVGKERPCLQYHLKACPGYCLPETDPSGYRAAMNQALMLLEGRGGELVHSLEAEMDEAAENLRFERAAQLRDQIRAVQGLSKRQRVISAVSADTDAVGFARGVKCCFVILHYVGGDLAAKDMELLDEPMETDGEAVSLLVRRHYSGLGAWPRTILLPVEPEDREELEALFSQAAGRKVSVEYPQRGDRRRLVEKAQLNAAEECRRHATAQQRRSKTLEWLQKTLELPQLPRRIEAYDISNLGATGIVGAMTVFQDGRPKRGDYRKFRIRDSAGPDDYHSMQEVISRRFRRCREGDEKFKELPDLILIDGGATHAQGAAEAMGELGYRLPVYGMVKDARHRTRALQTPEGQEISLNGNPAVFALVGAIQDETHRCAIEYQRALRREGLKGELDAIPGVGEKRRAQLQRQFKTLSAIRAASEEELRRAVPANTARAVYAWFHGDEGTAPAAEALGQTHKEE